MSSIVRLDIHNLWSHSRRPIGFTGRYRGVMGRLWQQMTAYGVMVQYAYASVLSSSQSSCVQMCSMQFLYILLEICLLSVVQRLEEIMTKYYKIIKLSRLWLYCGSPCNRKARHRLSWIFSFPLRLIPILRMLYWVRRCMRVCVCSGKPTQPLYNNFIHTHTPT